MQGPIPTQAEIQKEFRSRSLKNEIEKRNEALAAKNEKVAPKSGGAYRAGEGQV
jgi:hypothetical protein